MRRRYLGDGIDLSLLTSNLPGALSQGASSAEGALLSSVLSTQQVQSALSQQAQLTATQQLAASIQKNIFLYLGAAAVIIFIIYRAGRGSRA